MPAMKTAQPELKLWTPRLQPYSDDEAIFTQAPFWEVFTRRLGITTRHQGNDLWDALKANLQTERWFEFALDWLTYCLGGEIVSEMPEEDVQASWAIILEVLYMCFEHGGAQAGDDMAEKLLLAAQMEQVAAGHFTSYHPSMGLPADFNWDEELEHRDTASSDSESKSEDGDVDGDYLPEMDDEIADGMDLDLDSDDDDNDAEDDPDDPMGQHDTQDEASLPNMVQTRRQRRPRTIVQLSTLEAAEDPVTLPYKWYNHIMVFFYPVVRPKSGLLEKLREICRAGNLLETSHPDVETSFRFHDWKLAYGRMLCRWTPRSMTFEAYELLL
ncbi:hypothetical protein C8R43DRAFT_945464 [Mycena crocata]|nr:hypothetical protein C8R43DRAFT_945464 [Mycena crocata]